jgi:hypothetical protein
MYILFFRIIILALVVVTEPVLMVLLRITREFIAKMVLFVVVVDVFSNLHPQNLNAIVI